MKFEIRIWLEHNDTPIFIPRANEVLARAFASFDPSLRHMLQEGSKVEVMPSGGDVLGPIGESLLRIDPRQIVAVQVVRVL